jgi:hypothetical protein
MDTTPLTKLPQLRARGNRRLVALPTDARRAEQWGTGPDRQELTLPSGNVILVQTPDLPRLVRRGGVPADLVEAVERGATRGIADALAAIRGEVVGLAPGARLAALADVWALINAFCVASAVDPPLSFDGRAGTVLVTRLSEADRLHIATWGAVRVGSGLLGKVKR